MREVLKWLLPALAAAACLGGCATERAPAATPAPAPTDNAPAATGVAPAPEGGSAGSQAENAAGDADRMERGIGDAILDMGERMGMAGKG